MHQIVRHSAWLQLLCLTFVGHLELVGQEASHPRHGDFTGEFKDPKTGSLIMRYRMRVPDKFPANKTLGLIVAFHGLHGNQDGLTGFAIDTARRVQIVDEYIVMGGKSKGEGWEALDDKDVLAWISWVKETYPVDPRRVHIVGMSNGGGMVKRFGWANQDLFASISSYCGVNADFTGAIKGPRAPPARGPMSPAETRTEWYFVHGDADTVVRADASRLAIKQLAVKGYRYIYREIDGADHGGVLGNAEVADDNFRFLHALRHKETAPTKQELVALASAASKLKSEKPEAALPLLAEATRMGGTVGAASIKSALGNSDVAVKKAAIQAMESVIFGREAILELVKLARDKSDVVRAAALKTLGALANWRFGEAQEYLIQTARKSSLPLEDRVAAIQSLGKAFKLMSLGWYEDKDLPWTLVLLLEDKELKVREAAFAALEAGVKESFGYKPDLATAERKAAAAKWRAWCEKQAGPLKAPAAKR